MTTRSLTIIDVDAPMKRTPRRPVAATTKVSKVITPATQPHSRVVLAVPATARVIPKARTKKPTAKDIPVGTDPTISKPTVAKTKKSVTIKKRSNRTPKSRSASKQAKETEPVTTKTKTKTDRLAVSKLKRLFTKSQAVQEVAPATNTFKTSPATPISYSNQMKPGILTGIKRHPLGHLLLEKKLREAGFRGGSSSDRKFLDKYSTDESIFCIRPQLVIQPKNQRDIEIATTLIAEETKRFSSLSLTPRAAGTGLSGGSLTDSIVIDVCAHLHKIGEVKEVNDTITITCEPGAMWRDVEKKLARHHAYLPPYTSSKDICTIGGSIANNAAGPDSLRYGHCADWVESLAVVLLDGITYTIKPLSYQEFKTLIKQKHEYARIARDIFALIEKNEKVLTAAKPKTKKNTAGYALWDVLPDGVAAFKTGRGAFDLTRLISGSQGTIGIITSVTMRALPIAEATTLLSIPLFHLEAAAKTITNALKYNPINIEIFDAVTFDLALKNPNFFKTRLHGLTYYKAMLAMYSMYHLRYHRQTPEFTILITLDKETVRKHPAAEIARDISGPGVKARLVQNPIEAEILWQIRRASYTLSKLQDPNKRPAAFLEDMTVPPENISRFLIEIKKLFKEFNVQAAMHGHGGNGHFHFYPLLDFTQKTTPLLVERMAERFYSTAIKYHGDICGEHNDGIIRTPYLNKMFSKSVLDLFKATEHIFDPDDIFNPGKKVNPRFDIKNSMRRTN